MREGGSPDQGRLSHYGRYDVPAIIEAPDDVTMRAIAYSLGSAGNVRTETLRAFTRQETDTALDKMA